MWFDFLKVISCPTQRNGFYYGVYTATTAYHVAGMLTPPRELDCRLWRRTLRQLLSPSEVLINSLLPPPGSDCLKTITPGPVDSGLPLPRLTVRPQSSPTALSDMPLRNFVGYFAAGRAYVRHVVELQATDYQQWFDDIRMSARTTIQAKTTA
jgi:hypothetical protein